MSALLLTFDVEEFVIPAEQGLPFDEERAHALGREGLEKAMELLARFGVPATLFMTIGFAERNQKLLADLQSAGHELGLHAWHHHHDYREMPAAEAQDWLGRGRQWIQETFSCPCDGYRANRFRSPGNEVLEAIGLRWTSNLHPTKVPGHYDLRDRPREIHREGKLVEIPVSVTPKRRWPVSWFWMRNLPATYLRLCARRAAEGTGFLNLYLHPWEFAELPRVKGLPLMGRLSVRRCGRPFLRDLERLLRWCEAWGFEGRTISRHLALEDWISPP